MIAFCYLLEFIVNIFALVNEVDSPWNVGSRLSMETTRKTVLLFNDHK
jgi:hypothetical protein